MNLFRNWTVGILACLALVNCNDNAVTLVEGEVLNRRPVATVYEISKDVECRENARLDAPVTMSLSVGDKVDLASSTDGAMKADGHYWVSVYPRLSQLPISCYVAARYLIPRQ